MDGAVGAHSLFRRATVTGKTVGDQELFHGIQAGTEIVIESQGDGDLEQTGSHVEGPIHRDPYHIPSVHSI